MDREGDIMSKAIFWDSDGTLMYGNESFLWSLDKVLNDHGYKFEKGVIKDFLRSVCSWFMTDKPHPDAVGEAWWEALLDNTKEFCQKHHVADKDIITICKEFRKNVVLYEYELYDDAEAILQYCAQLGYKNYLISNNFPELVKVFERLGLDIYFEEYFLSANIGYEKPRAEIFQYALEKTGNPEVCYMVGDNPVADVKGARAVGMKTILVHRKAEDIQPDYACNQLLEIRKIIAE